MIGTLPAIGRRVVAAFGVAVLLGALVAAAHPVRAQDAPRVNVRAGAHDVFTRLVFDWPSRVPYEMSKSGGLVTLTFDAAGDIQTARINRNPPLFIGGLKTAQGGGKTVVIVAVPPASRVKAFYAGTRVALDVREPAEWQDPVALPEIVEVPGAAAAPKTETAQPAPATTPPPAAAPAAPPAVAVAQLPQASAPAAAAAVQPETAIATATEQRTTVAAQQTAQPAQPARPAASLNDLMSGNAGPDRAPPPATRAPTPAPAAPAASLNDLMRGNAGADRAPAVADPATPPGRPLSLTPPSKTEQTPPPAVPTAPAVAPTTPAAAPAATAATTDDSPGEAPSAQLSVARGEEGDLTVRFEWDEPVAAAAFRRNGILWLVFDKRANVNVPALRQAGEGVFRSLQQVYIPQATVLRMTTTKGVNPSVRRQGLAWLINFREQDLIPRVPIELQVQTDSPIGARLFLPLAEPGKVIPLTDPLVGDNLLVVPGVQLGHGVAGNYRYPQFELIQSAQGVVVAPTIDDVRVRALRQGVGVASAAPTFPLRFSPVSQEVAASARAAALRPLVRLLDLEKWDTPNPAAILQTRWVLENNVARAQGPGKQPARMDLARFYFANAYAAEALGVLERAAEIDEGILQDREYMLLRGASQALMGRPEDATKDLYVEILDGNDEAEFWRAIVQAESGDLNGASIELRRSGAMARPYPRPLRFRLATVVADAMVEIGDTRNAETQISTLLSDGPDVYQEAKIKFVQGRLAELEGDFDGAVTLWEDVMLSPDRLARYRGARARAELLMRLGRITREEGIEEIEKLRFAWRGDDREFELLRRLGDLYLEEDRYRLALQTLRQAATHFRDHRDAKAVTKLMSDTFNALYLEEKADVLPPVKAIAIYEEFKELTPAGAAGDTMIQKLADRLVGVDLLDAAAGLLENQIKFRLRGADKARVGARLGLIHLLDRKFADAERVLRATAETGLSPELAQQRTHLLSQSLMGQKKYPEALVLLAQDQSLDGELLRSEINWSTGNWVDASQALQRVVVLSGARRGENLNQRQARYLLNLATAMTLSGNERGLTRIRNNFAPAMAQTEFAQAFTLIAARPALGLIAPESVKQRVEVAQNFKTFLTGYRERLEQNPLSAIN